MAAKCDLRRDVLDQLLKDRKHREFGRVDGVIVYLRQDRPPRLGEIELGMFTVLRRVNRRFAAWVERVASRVSPVRLDSVRLPFKDIRFTGLDIEMPVDAETDDRLLRAEKWLRGHLIKRLPGAGK